MLFRSTVVENWFPENRPAGTLFRIKERAEGNAASTGRAIDFATELNVVRRAGRIPNLVPMTVSERRPRRNSPNRRSESPSPYDRAVSKSRIPWSHAAASAPRDSRLPDLPMRAEQPKPRTDVYRPESPKATLRIPLLHYACDSYQSRDELCEDGWILSHQLRSCTA